MEARAHETALRRAENLVPAVRLALNIETIHDFIALQRHENERSFSKYPWPRGMSIRGRESVPMVENQNVTAAAGKNGEEHMSDSERCLLGGRKAVPNGAPIAKSRPGLFGGLQQS
jgi:hypothetical protein